MWGAVGKSGSPISRWMTLAPAASMALARASTSRADSVPSLLMRSARGNAVMAVMIRLGCYGSRATRAVRASRSSPIRDGHAMVVGTRAAAERTTTMPAHAPISPAQQRRAAQVNDLLPLGDWYRHHSLRSWPVLLFLVLICVPSIALVILGGSPSPRTFEHVAWIFAAYFAIAWLLLLGVIVRPDHVPRTMLVVLIGPVLPFILDFVWRFVPDPISHACWAGLTGYFIGLAATGRHKWYTVAWIGVAVAAVLHGLNDWGRVNGHPAWILVVLVSGVLFLGYAKVGSRGDLHLTDAQAPAFMLPHAASAGHPPRPDGRPAVTSAGPAPGMPARHPALGAPGTPARHPALGAPTRTTRHRPWWEH